MLVVGSGRVICGGNHGSDDCDHNDLDCGVHSFQNCDDNGDHDCDDADYHDCDDADYHLHDDHCGHARDEHNDPDCDDHNDHNGLDYDDHDSLDYDACDDLDDDLVGHGDRENDEHECVDHNFGYGCHVCPSCGRVLDASDFDVAVDVDVGLVCVHVEYYVVCHGSDYVLCMWEGVLVPDNPTRTF